MAILSLKNEKEFDLVNKFGSKKHGTYLILVLSTKFSPSATEKSDSTGSTFFGMKVSRKFSKKAVIRNKVRRRIRHLVRNLVKDTTLNTQNTATIIIPKKGLDQANFKELTADFRHTYKNALSY